MLVEIPWANFLRAEWEENPGTPINSDKVTGFSIGLSTSESSSLNGTIWIDDLSLMGTTSPATQPPTEQPPSVPEAGNPLCCNALILPLLLGGLFFWKRV
jgi:hypothetical protein